MTSISLMVFGYFAAALPRMMVMIIRGMVMRTLLHMWQPHIVLQEEKHLARQT